jgi:hypothetical protein
MFEWLRKKEPQPDISAGGSVIHRYSNSEWASTLVGSSGESAIRFGKAREEVYTRLFGEVHRVFHEVFPLIPHIDVMEYHLNGQNGRVCTLVTSGMSNLAMNVPKKTAAPRRVELIFYCSESKQEYADTMRWLAHFPHDQKTWIGSCHTIPNGNPPTPLWGTAMDTILLLPPIVRKDQNLCDELILDGDGVEFLWVVPLTTAECNLKLAKGTSAVLELLDQNRHSYVFDPNRASYV